MVKKFFGKKPGKTPVEVSESTQASSEKKGNKFFNLLWWLFLLAILAEGCFLLYPDLTSQYAGQASEISDENTIPTETDSLALPALDIQPATEQKEPMPLLIHEPPAPEPEESLPAAEEPVPEPEPPVEPAEPEQTQNQPVLPRIPNAVWRIPGSATEPATYSITQALAFKEAIIANKNCREHVAKLLQVAHQTPIMEQVTRTFLPYCLDQEAHDDISIFLAHKKQAVLMIFQQKYPAWQAYIYSLPWLVMNIRKINPDSDSAMDVLDRLHNAMLTHNTSDALAELDKLPPVVAAIFNDIRQQLLEQQKRIALLDELILSLAGKGE